MLYERKVENMTPEEVKLREEYEQIKDQPMFFEDGRMNHRLAGVSFLVGLLDGLSQEIKPKKEVKQNNIDHHWKHKKKGGN